MIFVGIDPGIAAIARDLMAEALLRLEAAGYPVVLTVHDEAVCETDKDRLDADPIRLVESVMCELPEWATGLPVAAEGWIGARYGK